MVETYWNWQTEEEHHVKKLISTFQLTNISFKNKDDAHLLLMRYELVIASLFDLVVSKIFKASTNFYSGFSQSAKLLIGKNVSSHLKYFVELHF